MDQISPTMMIDDSMIIFERANGFRENGWLLRESGDGECIDR